MSNFLIKNVHICGTETGTRVDIAIRNGVITEIGSGLSADKGTPVLDHPGAWISPGWLDLGTFGGDPGFEHREDLPSLSRAAAAGGFTAIANQPNTQPAIHGKTEVLYIRNKTAGLPVNFFPIGAISQDCAGKDLTELYDMHHAGAIAFSDGNRPVEDAGLLLRALQYAQAFNGLIINQPYQPSISAGGQMHEGLQSTMLGMKGIPALAETIAIQRDLSLLAYAGGRLHIHMVSSAEGLNLIREARAAGLDFSCSVAVANLAFTDEHLAGFDTNYKVKPPLRSPADRQALLEALEDGTIDCICTNHCPWDTEAKALEFTYARFGMTALETAFALSRTATVNHLSVERLVDKWSSVPRRVLGLPVPEIAVGQAAELTLFHPDMEWTVQSADLRSKSSNTPLTGATLRGRVLGIINKGQGVWNTGL